MPTQISWSVTVQVGEGPKLTAFDDLAVEAYDVIDVVIQPDNAAVEVDLQPGAAGKVQFLLIKTDHPGAHLTYKVNAAGDPRGVDAKAMFLAGPGAIQLLDPANPVKSLEFTNDGSIGTAKPATVKILVGRKATP